MHGRCALSYLLWILDGVFGAGAAMVTSAMVAQVGFNPCLHIRVVKPDCTKVQSNRRRPIVSCTVKGWLTGDAKARRMQ